MNVGAILDNVAGELDAQVLAYMQEYAIPPSLMDKVLDRIQSHMRQMKSEEYAQELMKTQIDLAVANTEQTGTEEQQPNQEQRWMISKISRKSWNKGRRQKCRHSQRRKTTEQQ